MKTKMTNNLFINDVITFYRNAFMSTSSDKCN